MSRISFLGFGGLNEKNKPCYAITVDNDIFLFDCGLSTPINAQLGVKKIIPDFNWIIQNANNVRGIFIGTPKYSNFASLPYLIKHIPKLVIYTSDIGAIIILNYFNRLASIDKHLNIKPNIEVMSPLVKKKIGSVAISSFFISNYLPKSLGFIISTNDGSIIFIDDFLISSNRNLAFKDQLKLINEITCKKNLLLITGCGNVSGNSGFTSPNHRTYDFFSEIITENTLGRTLITCHDYDFYTIMTIADICARKKRPFIIYSRSLSRTFRFICNKQYFKNDDLSIINENEISKTNNAVIIIAGNPESLIRKIELILNDEDPRLQILSNDYFICATHTVNGYEKMEAQMFDHIVRSNAKKIIRIPKDFMLATSSVEDHKFLIDLIRPKYSIPINGLYMNMSDYRDVVSLSFMKWSNVIILRNGQQINFIDGDLQKETKFHKLVLQFVNSTGTVDTGSPSIFEREIMAKDGVVVANIVIDKKNKKISRFNFEPIGVINLSNENKLILEKMNKEILGSLGQYLVNNVRDSNELLDTKEFKYFTKKIFNKYYLKNFEKQPLIALTLIFQKW